MIKDENLKIKIQAYIDGELSPEENQDFENEMMRNSELAREFKQRKKDLEFLQEMIPEYKLESEKIKSLQVELEQVVKDLIRPKTDSFSEKISFLVKELF